MADTRWADVSQWQGRPADNSYPHGLFAFRCYHYPDRDTLFAQNIAWARGAIASGKLWGFIVYYFYRPETDGAKILRDMVGKPDPRMVAMIDVEADHSSDYGPVTGNHSAKINAQFDALASWTGDKRQVIGYGNVGDLNTLWPSKPSGARLIVANYSSKPSYPGMFAHQYADDVPCAPFGPCDANVAYGQSAADLQAMFGFTAKTTRRRYSQMTTVSS